MVHGKGLAFQEGYPRQWEVMTKAYPDIEEGSTSKYQNWETVDPEKWVPYFHDKDMTGSGAFWHDDLRDRPSDIFGGNITLYAGRGRDALSSCTLHS